MATVIRLIISSLIETRGLSEMLFNYTANNLNRHTQRTVPGIVPPHGGGMGSWGDDQARR